jgi:hypothetical protein
MITTLVVISIVTISIIGAIWLAAATNIVSVSSFGSLIMPQV